MNASGRCRWALALALFLTMWGARLVVVERFGSDLPFWDQWDKEADKLYAKWFEQRDAKHLFLPHNEHRIFPTLALNLGLVIASGQWDARVQCAIGAALNAAILAGFFLWFSSQVSRRWIFVLALAVAAVGVAPIPWENIVGGFQTQFYFLIGFSLLAIGGLGLARAFSWRWWSGVGASALALVSMGSGVLCSVPAAILVCLRCRAGAATRRDAAATLVVALLVGIAGAALHTRVPYHEALHAHSPEKFLLYAVRCLAWPLSQHPWLGVLFWLPWLALAARRVKGAFRPGDQGNARASIASGTEDYVLAAGLWVLAQIAAVAYSRGGTGELPASRYGDVFALGFLISFCALVLMIEGRRGRSFFVAVWLLPATLSLASSARHAWAGSLPGRKTEFLAYEQNLRDFVRTDAFSALHGQRIPFPSAEALARILRQPAVRAILPASVRAPLRLADFSNPPPAPVPPTHHRTRALLQTGEWRSGPLPVGSGWWVLDTAGHFDQPGVALDLVAVSDGRILSTLRPSKTPGNSWRAAYAPAPREPAVLRARTDSAAHWLAFSEPVEMSTLSHYTWRLTKHSRWIVLLGGAGALVIVAGCAWQSRRERARLQA